MSSGEETGGEGGGAAAPKRKRRKQKQKDVFGYNQDEVNAIFSLEFLLEALVVKYKHNDEEAMLDLAGFFKLFSVHGLFPEKIRAIFCKGDDDAKSASRWLRMRKKHLTEYTENDMTWPTSLPVHAQKVWKLRGNIQVLDQYTLRPLMDAWTEDANADATALEKKLHTVFETFQTFPANGLGCKESSGGVSVAGGTASSRQQRMKLSAAALAAEWGTSAGHRVALSKAMRLPLMHIESSSTDSMTASLVRVKVKMRVNAGSSPNGSGASASEAGATDDEVVEEEEEEDGTNNLNIAKLSKADKDTIRTIRNAMAAPIMSASAIGLSDAKLVAFANLKYGTLEHLALQPMSASSRSSGGGGGAASADDSDSDPEGTFDQDALYRLLITTRVAMKSKKEAKMLADEEE